MPLDTTADRLPTPSGWVLAPPFADRVGWQNQPQHPVGFNLENSLLLKAEVVMLGSLPPINLVNKNAPTISGTISKYATHFGCGPGLKFSSYYSWPSVAGTGGWTAAVVVIPVQLIENGGYLIGLCEAPGSATHDRSIEINASGLWASYAYDSEQRRCVTTVSPTLNKQSIVIAASDGASLFCNADGIEGTPVAIVNGGYNGYATPEFCIGKPSNNSENFNWVFMLAVRVNRCWTQAERTSFAQNPWQLFAADY